MRPAGTTERRGRGLQLQAEVPGTPHSRITICSPEPCGYLSNSTQRSVNLAVWAATPTCWTCAGEVLAGKHAHAKGHRTPETAGGLGRLGLGLALQC